MLIYIFFNFLSFRSPVIKYSNQEFNKCAMKKNAIFFAKHSAYSFILRFGAFDFGKRGNIKYHTSVTKFVKNIS